MSLYSVFFSLVFAKMDPEKAHQLGFALIRLADRTPAGPLLRKLTAPDPSLRTRALGLDFPSPFGLAAGFDKNGTGVISLTNLGFSHVEVGTVTGQGQPGNARPRLFRLPQDQALINRMGFNNDGALAVAPRLARAHAKLRQRLLDPGTARVRPVIGVNIGKTKKVGLREAGADYLASARTLAPLADYLVVNVSSPNTPGLRSLQSVRALRPLLVSVRKTANQAAGRQVPLLVKIAPDLSDEEVLEVVDLVNELKLDGVVATNTTVTRNNLATPAEEVISMGVGGLSGQPLKSRSLEILRLLRAHLNPEVTIISVGGVQSAKDVQERLDLGATLVQGYTAFLYQGPFWAHRINRGLSRLRKP